jgi:hypothetical protein
LGPRPGQPTARLIDTAAAAAARAPGPLVADHQGFGVYADRGLDGRDREQLFQLCRYLARPPVALERLERLPGGRLCYRLKRPWRDGTSAVVLHPWDLLVRLCALVPPPRFHLVRASGVLASHASLRSLVVPGAEPAELDSSHGPVQMPLPLDDGSALPQGGPASTPVAPPPRPFSSRTPWAKLLARVFRIDVTVCPDPACRGPMRIVGFATTPEEIAAEMQQLPRAPPAPSFSEREPPSQGRLQIDLRQLGLVQAIRSSSGVVV